MRCGSLLVQHSHARLTVLAAYLYSYYFIVNSTSHLNDPGF